MRIRILKVDELIKAVLNKLNKSYGLKAPLDTVVLVFMFVLGSYIPPLVASVIYHSFIKSEPPKVFNE